MTVKNENVEIELGRSEEDPRKHAVFIKVESKKKPKCKKVTEVDPGKVAGQKELLHLIYIGAAACAEECCETFGDSLDPSHMGNLAVKAFGEEVKLVAQLNQDLPVKIVRLLERKSQLHPWELELISKIDFVLKRGNSCTVKEIQFINKTLSRFHGVG